MIGFLLLGISVLISLAIVSYLDFGYRKSMQGKMCICGHVFCINKQSQLHECECPCLHRFESV